MALDQDNPNRTSIDPSKKTTKVNIGVVAGVVIFFAVAVAALAWMVLHRQETVSNEHEKRTESVPATR